MAANVTSQQESVGTSPDPFAQGRVDGVHFASDGVRRGSVHELEGIARPACDFTGRVALQELHVSPLI